MFAKVFVSLFDTVSKNLIRGKVDFGCGFCGSHRGMIFVFAG